jgi:hypothetical protein
MRSHIRLLGFYGVRLLGPTQPPGWAVTPVGLTTAAETVGLHSELSCQRSCMDAVSIRNLKTHHALLTDDVDGRVLLQCKISGPRRSDYVEYRLLGCDAV